MNNLYEKKYKEALIRAKAMIKIAINKDEAIGFANTIFPELKMSEDERIRKEILEYIDKATGCKNWIAWLEKQGEQEKPQVYKTDDGEVITYSESEGYKVIEPKFKVGDWILYSGDHYEGVRHITKINENGYYIERNGLPHGIIPFNHEICIRLWTIQDAKDGDVLSDGTTIFIFKDLLSDGSVMSYCDYDTDSGDSDAFCPLSVNLMCSKITPTTKEQCDLLFQKMKEAGYMWDSETKELKGIEQNSAWSEEDEEILITIFSYFKVDLECTDEDDIVKWLKSLKNRVQPHWKPTEEQMNAFYWMKQYPAGEFAKKDILNSLYNDLKKL